eukprot:3483634-Alexandrium_andersonii.AAC.1
MAVPSLAADAHERWPRHSERTEAPIFGLASEACALCERPSGRSAESCSALSQTPSASLPGSQQ